MGLEVLFALLQKPKAPGQVSKLPNFLHFTNLERKLIMSNDDKFSKSIFRRVDKSYLDEEDIFAYISDDEKIPIVNVKQVRLQDKDDTSKTFTLGELQGATQLKSLESLEEALFNKQGEILKMKRDVEFLKVKIYEIYQGMYPNLTLEEVRNKFPL